MESFKGFEWWNKTITHYQREINENDEVTFTRVVYDNCSFTSKSEERISNNDSKIVKVCTVRLLGDVDIKERDIIALGNIDIEIDEYTESQKSSDFLRNNQDSFEVNYVGYNDWLTHTKVQGDANNN